MRGPPFRGQGRGSGKRERPFRAQPAPSAGPARRAHPAARFSGGFWLWVACGTGKEVRAGKEKIPAEASALRAGLYPRCPSSSWWEFLPADSGENSTFCLNPCATLMAIPVLSLEATAHHLPAFHVCLVRRRCWWRPWCLGQPHRWEPEKWGFRWKTFGTATSAHALAAVCCKARSPLWIFLFPRGRVGLTSKDWKMPISCSGVYALRFLEKDAVMDHDG